MRMGANLLQHYQEEFKELSTEAMLPNEIADMARFYRELGAQKSDIEKQYKELSEHIKQTMKAANARQGSCGEYVCKLTLVEQDRIDKELLTPAELLRATKKITFEKLTISSPKRKEIKNGNGADNASI